MTRRRCSMHRVHRDCLRPDRTRSRTRPARPARGHVEHQQQDHSSHDTNTIVQHGCTQSLPVRKSFTVRTTQRWPMAARGLSPLRKHARSSHETGKLTAHAPSSTLPQFSKHDAKPDATHVHVFTPAFDTAHCHVVAPRRTESWFSRRAGRAAHHVHTIIGRHPWPST